MFVRVSIVEDRHGGPESPLLHGGAGVLVCRAAVLSWQRVFDSLNPALLPRLKLPVSGEVLSAATPVSRNHRLAHVQEARRKSFRADALGRDAGSLQKEMQFVG